MRLPIFKFGLVLIALGAIFYSAISAHAQTSPTPAPTATPAVSDDEVNRISKGLYCPICQNVPLEVCETAACGRWREQVRDLIAQGQTEQQIRAYFIEHFGAQTVGIPTNPVIQLLTIALPFTLIAVVGILIGINLVVWRNKHPAIVVKPKETTVDTAPESDDYRARLEDEVKRRE